MDEIDQILGADQQQTLPAEAEATPTEFQAPKGLDDIDRILNDGHAVDDLTGEKIPLPLSGNTPETAMNRSILSATDRFKLSVGNLAGNVKYLQEKFGPDGVKQIKDSKGVPTKDLAVFQDGSWYRVDPYNGYIADPWERTKEYIKDAAEFAPEAIGVATGIGITAATGGAGAVPAAVAAGAVSGTVRTSLGRIVGTYDATPQEQAYDIGFETILNAAGVKIAAGVKPTGKWIANNAVKPVAETFKDLATKIPAGADPYVKAMARVGRGALAKANDYAQTPKNLWLWATSAGNIGVDHAERLVSQPNAVKALMSQADDVSSKLGSADRARRYQDYLVEGQLSDIKNYAKNAKQWSQSLYSSMRNRVLSQVPNDFTANFDEPIIATYRDAISKGIGKIELGDETLYGTEAMEWLNKHGIEGIRRYGAKTASVPKATTTAVGKYLGKSVGIATGGVDDTIEMTAQGAGRARFSLLTPGELKAKFRQGAALADEMNYLANNDDAWRAVNSFYRKLDGYIAAAPRKGVQAAEDLMQFKKAINDVAYDIANSEKVKNLGNVKTILDSARHQVTDAIYKKFNATSKAIVPSGSQGLAETSLARSFREMDSTYNQMKTVLAPTLQAYEKYNQSKNLMEFGPLLQAYTDPTAKSIRMSMQRTRQQQGIEFMLDVAEQYGAKDVAINLATTKNNIMLKETAKVLNPMRGGVAKAETHAANKIGMSAYAATTGNARLGLAIATAGILTNPRAGRAGAAVVRGMYHAQNFVSKQTPQAIDKMLSTPEGAMAIGGAGAAALASYMQTGGSLDQMAQQALGQ